MEPDRFLGVLALISVKGLEDAIIEGYVSGADFADVDPEIASNVEEFKELHDRLYRFVEDQFAVYGIDWS